MIFALFALAVTVATVTDIRPITLHPGVNQIPGFVPGGGTATIIQAWRGNGNAHGYTVWMVLAPETEGKPFGVIDGDFRSNQPSSDVIVDDPFDGERTLGVVKFARAKVNGVPTSILIDAHLDAAPSGVLADHATATITTYRLVHTDGLPGSTPDVFEPVSTIHTTRRFCNADLALHETLGLPLSSDYGGANQVDGCFPQ